MNEGIAVHQLLRDDAGKPSDYRIIAINPSFERILGIKENDVSNKRGSATYIFNGVQLIDQFAAVVETGVPVSFDAYFPSRDRHFRINAFAYGLDMFATVFSDITEQVHIKESLEKTITERDILLRELHHRIKNDLQLVSGLIILEKEKMKEDENKEILSFLEKKIQESPPFTENSVTRDRSNGST